MNKPNVEFSKIKDRILEPLYRILQYNDKSIKATDLILHSDLERADAQKINLPSFIEGYFQETKFDIKVHISKSINKFNIIGSKLDLALIFDNLIDNSKKWKSNNVWIYLGIENNCAILNFHDDGIGLDEKFKDNPNDIFNFKTSARKDGTGFGLYLVKESLIKMNAEISIDDPKDFRGMNFNIIFK